MRMRVLNVVAFLMVALTANVLAQDPQSADTTKDKNALASPVTTPAFKPQPYSPSRDMAFISVMGSRPKSSSLKGYQKAVLYNARGAVIQEVDISRDSVYSLDKMIQENRNRGPLFIRMVR